MTESGRAWGPVLARRLVSFTVVTATALLIGTGVAAPSTDVLPVAVAASLPIAVLRAPAPEAVAEEPSCNPLTGRELAWIDDFDGPAGSPVDPSMWIASEGAGGWGNDELQNYRPENAQLDGASHLVMSALIDEAASNDLRFTSARLTGVQGFGDGILSARIRIPDGTGLLPAFWALGSDFYEVGWPASGEIDVVETPFGTQRTFHTLHGPSASGDHVMTGTDVSHPAPLSADFHIYWLDRSPGRIVIGIDAQRLATFDPATIDPELLWVFDKPFTPLLSLAIGGVWPGSPDATTPARSDMLVDWVRFDAACTPAA